VKLRYPGQYADSYGVNYNYFRDYEAGTGRYLESDPIGLEGGNNTYLYVNGSPVIYFDANGLQGVCQFLACASKPPHNLISFAAGQAAMLPKPMLPNGNIEPNFTQQDMICSDQASPLNWTPAKSCCVAHDECYTVYGCNRSSWAGISRGWSPCGQCNVVAAHCVLTTLGLSH
jgi:RHS repeat-associated protein